MGAPGVPGKNFGPPKRKCVGVDNKKWENKERGPKGPIKERYSGRMGGLYDDPNDSGTLIEPDFDDIAASKAGGDDADE